MNRRILVALFAFIMLFSLSVPAWSLIYVSSLDGFSVGETVRLTGYYTASSDGQGTKWRGYYEYYVIKLIASGTANPYALRPVNMDEISGWTNASCIQHLYVAVDHVNLDRAAATIAVKGALTLSASVSPSNATNGVVTWTSSKPTVAKVVGGVVTGVSTGSAAITATAEGKTACCNVTVVKRIVNVKSISFAYKMHSIYLNNSEKLKVRFLPSDATDKSLMWTSSNPSIASVDASGKVTAKAVGRAVITAVSANGKTASCIVDVKVRAVRSVTIPSSVRIIIGSTKQLTAKISPSDASYKAVTWTSNNEQVASVSGSGVVTGRAFGTATISAMAVGGKCDTCHVTVIPIYVTHVALPGELVLASGQTTTLSATITPSNATNQSLAWSSSNSAVANVGAGGVVIARAPGCATITVCSSNSKKASCNIYVPLGGMPQIGSGYTMDLNGDRKADMFQATCSAHRITLWVNSAKSVWDWGAFIPSLPATGFRVYIGDIQLRDKYFEIFVRSPTTDMQNGYMTLWAIFRYDGKRLTRMKISHSGGGPGLAYYPKDTIVQMNATDVISADGSGTISFVSELTMGYSTECSAGYMYRHRYKLKSGALSVVPDSTLYSSSWGDNWHTALRTFHAYTSPSTSTSKVTIAKGTQLTIPRASMLGWYELKLGNGSLAYIKLDDKDRYYPDKKPLDTIIDEWE